MDAHDHLRSDETMGPLVERYGEFTVEPADDLYERLVVAVINQLISQEAGETIKGRLFDAVEISPEGILAADEQTLRDAGLSPQKVSAVTNAAEWFIEDGVNHAYFEGMDDAEALAALTEISGVGDWTAKIVLMFGLGRADVFPVEDLGIRKGMEVLFDRELTRGEMRELAEPWRPYRTVASRYVWHHRRAR